MDSDSDSGEEWWDERTNRRTNTQAPTEDIKTFHERHEDWFNHGLEIENYERNYRRPADNNGPYSICYDDIYKNFDEQVYLRQHHIYKKARFKILTSEEAVCTTVCTALENRRLKININGRINCGQAYSDDIVYVKLENDGKSEADGKHYGKVISLVERNRFRDIEHPVFICTKDRNQGHLMLPICKTVPKISVLHGRIAEDRLRTSVEVHSYVHETRSLVFDKYLTIKEDNRQDYLFVVVLIKWKRTNTYPLGAVLGDIRCTSNVEEAMTLLSLQHRIPLWSEYTTLHEFQSERVRTQDPIFTVGEPNERYINHGFSVKKRSSNMIICVHVADISRLVQKHSELDEMAKKRGVSLSASNHDITQEMFPEQVLTTCSLTAGLRRHTFTVVIEVNENGDIVHQSLRKSITQLNRQYTFLEAERIIANETEEMNEFEAVDLRMLHAVSEKLRCRRLSHSSLSVNAKIDLLTDCSFMSTTKARNMVQELIYQANQIVGQLLQEKFPNTVPLFTQLPNVDIIEKAEMWYETNKNTASLAVQCQNQKFINFPPFRIDNVLTHSLSPEGNQQHFVVSLQGRILNHIINLLYDDHFSEAIFYLSCDSLFPKQAIVLNEMNSLNPLSQYSVIPTNTALVHFTQPFDRYCDLIIQRLVNAYIENTAAPYEPGEIRDLCNMMNKSLKKKSILEDEFKTTAVALHLKNTPISFLCHIRDISEEEFCILVPGLQHLKKRFIIRYKDIGVCNISREIPENESDCAVQRECSQEDIQEDTFLKLLIEWRMRIYSYTETVEQPALEGTEPALIYPHAKAAFVSCSFWKDVIRHVISQNNQALSQTFLGVTNDLEDVECSENSVRDISSETDDDIIVNHAVQFGMCLHRGQIISVQLSSEEESGKSTPTPQILNLTDNVKLCLVHVKDPIKIFSKYALKSTIHDTERSYRRVRDYLDIWIPILEMESTINAVKDRTPIIINHIPVKFRDGQGYFEVNEEFCEKRDLYFGHIPETEVTEEKHYYNLPSGSYLCIMFPQELDDDSKIKIGNKYMHEESVIWTGHAVTTKICKYLKRVRRGQRARKTLRVVFSMHERSPQPPVTRFDKCRIEVLHKSTDERRLERNLKALPNASELTKNIALGSRVNVLGRLHIAIAERVIDEGLNAGLWENNDNQHWAIRTSLQRKFKLIQGPPGTGKTYIGVKLIYLFNKFNTLMANESGEERKKIVFCGPSNKSVDLVARLVLQHLQENAPKFVRVYAGSFEHMDFQNEGTAFYERWNLHGLQTDQFLIDNERVLHHIIRQEGKPYAEQLKHFEENEEIPTLEEVKEYKKILIRATMEELPNYDVIFCTTSMVANPRVVRAIQGKVYQLIIDESGMCSEPSTIVPIIASAAEQVVLIGDHKQLRPIVICGEAAKLGLETSLFERYSNDHMYRTMLNVQYRMHPDICEFPSNKFYGGELRTNPGIGSGYDPLSIWPRSNERHIPHVFCHVEGTEERLVVKTEAGNEQSRYNQDEVEHVVRLYDYLVDEERVPPESINVMSQYNAQCTRLREELPQANVSTVVQSQGGEWNYVIFSLVRSLPDYQIPETPTVGWKNQALGFITDQNQINVALTRAKRGLIIIGNTKLLRCDPVWKDLIQHYRQKGCVFDAGEFPLARNR